MSRQIAIRRKRPITAQFFFQKAFPSREKSRSVRGVIRGDKCFVDGREVTREEFDRLIPDAPRPRRRGGRGRPGAAFVQFKPIVSDALAVHPRQVKEATEHATKLGVPTDFQPDGRPVLRTRAHRAAYLRAYGFFDRDAGYGDPAPGMTKRDIPDQNLKELY